MQTFFVLGIDWLNLSPNKAATVTGNANPEEMHAPLAKGFHRGTLRDGRGGRA